MNLDVAAPCMDYKNVLPNKLWTFDILIWNMQIATVVRLLFWRTTQECVVVIYMLQFNWNQFSAYFAIFRLKDCWNDFLQILSWRNCIKSWEQKSTDRKLPSYDSCRRCNQSVSIFIFGTEDVITLFSLQFYIATKCSLWEQVQNGKMATKVYFSCEVKVYWGHHVLERGKHLLGKPNKWKKNKESKSWEKTLTKEWNNAGGWSKKDMLKRQWKNQSRVGKGKQRMEPKAEKVESRQNNVI